MKLDRDKIDLLLSFFNESKTIEQAAWDTQQEPGQVKDHMNIMPAHSNPQAERPH